MTHKPLNFDVLDNFLSPVNGTLLSKRVLANGGKPTILFPVDLGVVVGVGATISMTGGELGGVITLTTGALPFPPAPLVPGIAAVFTLVKPMPHSNFSVVFSPALPTVIASDAFASSVSDSSFVLVSCAPLVFLPTTVYAWNYQIVGYQYED